MVSTFRQPNYAEDTGTVYPTAIDDAVAAMKRIGAAFAAHESDPVAMTVTVDAGAVVASGVLAEVAAQTTGSITAPSSDPRIDRVVIDASTGTAEVVQGAEDPTPAAPSIPAGKLPVARLALTVGMMVITNADITDERVGAGSGGGLNPGTPTELTLADGAVTVTGGYHTVDTEPDTANPDGVAADTLYSIDPSNLAEGALLILAAENASRVVTLSGEDTGSNITLAGGDFALDTAAKRIVLQRVGSDVVEVARSASGGAGIAKAWVKFNGTGTLAIDDSFNVSSVTDNGTGNYTVNWVTDFGSATYCAVMTGGRSGSGNNSGGDMTIGDGGMAAGSLQIESWRAVTNNSESPNDVPEICVVVFGG